MINKYMVTGNKKNEYLNKILSMAPFFILLISMIILHRFEKMQPGDDYWFQQIPPKYTFFKYVEWRYFDWSGRVSVESVLYFIFKDSGELWKIINPIVITIFAYAISRIVLGRKEYQDRKNILLNSYICVGWLFISMAVLKASIFWMTGSINYLWPVTAGLLAIIPFRDALIKEYKGKISMVLYLLPAIFAAFGQEQTTLVIVAFSTLINIYIFIRDKKIYKYLIFQNVIMIIGAIVILLAPGNFNRNHIEMNNWLPNYLLYSKWEIGFYGIQWLFNNLLNDCRVIFMLLIAIVSIALYRKNNNKIRKKISVLIPIAACILIIVGILFSLNNVIPKPIIERINFSADYNIVWSNLSNIFFDFNLPFSLSVKSALKFFLWSVIVVLIPYFILYLYDFKIKGFYTALIYIAGICTAVVMFLSPTIYVSGQRTLFVLATLFFLTFIIILKDQKYLLKKRYFILFIIIPIIKYIFILEYLIHIK